MLNSNPTLANLLGFSPPSYVFGQDILNTAHPIVIRRAPNTGIIKAIFSPDLYYFSSTRGIFEDGKCFQAYNGDSTAIKDCKTLYDNQSTKIRISDTIVRGNLTLPLANESGNK